MGLASYIATLLLVILGSAVAGAIFIPAFNFMFGKALPRGVRTALGRIIWCMGSLALDENRLVRTPAGYKLRKVVEEDGQKYIFMGEGDLRELEDGGYVTRFGLVDFGVSYLPEGERWEEIRADDIPGDTQAVADGGIRLLSSQRAGYQEFVPECGEGEELIKIDKAEEPIRNAAGASQANNAEDITLKKYGGYNDVSNTTMAVVGLVALIFGAMSAWLIMGGPF